MNTLLLDDYNIEAQLEIALMQRVPLLGEEQRLTCTWFISEMEFEAINIKNSMNAFLLLLAEKFLLVTFLFLPNYKSL